MGTPADSEKFPQGLVDVRIFDAWLEDEVLAYNSFLRKDGIQVPCADCFYLTDLITFIK